MLQRRLPHQSLEICQHGEGLKIDGIMLWEPGIRKSGSAAFVCREILYAEKPMKCSGLSKRKQNFASLNLLIFAFYFLFSDPKRDPYT